MNKSLGLIGPIRFDAKTFSEMQEEALTVVIEGSDGGTIIFVRSTSTPAGKSVGDHAWGTKSWRGEPVA